MKYEFLKYNNCEIVRAKITVPKNVSTPCLFGIFDLSGTTYNQ